MRTFATFLVAVVLVFATGCGGGSNNKGTSSTGRSGSTGGQCPSTTGQNCTGGDAYTQCEMAACGTQYKACFGNNFASGDFTGGACADWLNCELPCPCDGSTAQSTCEGNCTAQFLTTAACATCLGTLGGCVDTGAGASCTQPVCPSTGTNTSTSTLTTTLTSTLTTTSTSTSTGCAAAAACCTALGASLGASVAQTCQSTLAGLTDAQCTAAISAYKQYCP